VVGKGTSPAQRMLPMARKWTCAILHHTNASIHVNLDAEPLDAYCYEGSANHPLIDGARIYNSDGSISIVKDGKVVEEKPAPDDEDARRLGSQCRVRVRCVSRLVF
jgi:hypothetical protein